MDPFVALRRATKQIFQFWRLRGNRTSLMEILGMATEFNSKSWRFIIFILYVHERAAKDQYLKNLLLLQM